MIGSVDHGNLFQGALAIERHSKAGGALCSGANDDVSKSASQCGHVKLGDTFSLNKTTKVEEKVSHRVTVGIGQLNDNTLQHIQQLLPLAIGRVKWRFTLVITVD